MIFLRSKDDLYYELLIGYKRLLYRLHDDKYDHMIILICGLPGSGKTYFAKALAANMGLVHINTDSVRKSIGKMSKYDRKSKDQVYAALFNRAQQVLAERKSVIIDATFMNPKHRYPYFNLSDQKNIKLKIIQVTAEEAIIFNRLKEKRPDSEADFQVYKKMKTKFDPLERDYLKLPSDQSSQTEMIRLARNYLDK